MKRFILISIMFGFFSVLKAQQVVSGRITDKADHKPLPGATIFLANTTIGTFSDDQGNYTLTFPGAGSFEISVTYVGYQSVFHKITKPGAFHTFNATLVQSELQLEEVNITTSKTYTQKDVDLFWHRFLGEKPSKKGMEVLNPEKVFFHYSDSVLKVSCQEPIEIFNHHTGYLIRYVLDSFTHDYANATTTLRGMPHFEEITPKDDGQQKKWKKNRQETYALSITRFLRALYQKQIHREGFLLVDRHSFLTGQLNPDLLDQILTTDQNRMLLNINESLQLACVSTPVTERMIHNFYGTISGSYERRGSPFRLVHLLPQLLVIYPDGTYTGDLRTTSLIGVSQLVPLEYAAQFGESTALLENKANLLPDSLMSIFENQMTVFPQEKIYLHTDKPYYLLDEKIWLRAYLVDAMSHMPAPASRYVYVELINPLNAVVDRIKILQKEGIYDGCIVIPENIPEGNYTLRAYTAYMRNQEENYFCTKSIYVGKPQTRDIQIKNKNNDLPSINLPVDKEDFNVSFYPEGGSLLLGTMGKVVFKAMKSNGQSIDVSGVVYNHSGIEVVEFESRHAGMGSFSLTPEKDNTYYAVCKNDKGQSKRFDLPVALNNGYALSVNNLVKDKIFISIEQPAEKEQNNELYLLAHTRGMVHFVSAWDFTKNLLSLPKDQFPSGVMHLILFNSEMHPISERLVFIQRPDQAQTTCQSDTENFTARSLVNNQVTITDVDGQPLSGSFSVAVTSDREVQPDSTTNILTQLLLTSDLRGTVENPSFYFQNTTASAWALDLLMCTQGWRRYNIPEMAKGRFTQPTIPLETGQIISGTVTNGMTGKPVENVEVTIMSIQRGYVENTKTDKDGRFVFNNCEFPDSSAFVVSATPNKGLARMILSVDEESFPERTLSTPFFTEIDTSIFEQYTDKTVQGFSYENGTRMIQLPEVTVTTDQKQLRKSAFYFTPSNSITEEDLAAMSSLPSVRFLLSKLPGVYASGNSISVRGSQNPPLLVVDDVVTNIGQIDVINPYEIAQIDLLKDAINTSAFGVQGANGVVVIFTKRGKMGKTLTPQFHIQTVKPLGFQSPVEFYAPVYDTNNTPIEPEKSDFRTTIHWLPDVRTDNTGTASFSFYTADENTSYTVIIEGIADNGKIIYKTYRLFRSE